MLYIYRLHFENMSSTLMATGEGGKTAQAGFQLGFEGGPSASKGVLEVSLVQP